MVQQIQLGLDGPGRMELFHVHGIIIAFAAVVADQYPALFLPSGRQDVQALSLRLGFDYPAAEPVQPAVRAKGVIGFLRHRIAVEQAANSAAWAAVIIGGDIHRKPVHFYHRGRREGRADLTLRRFKQAFRHQTPPGVADGPPQLQVRHVVRAEIIPFVKNPLHMGQPYLASSRSMAVT